MSPVLLIASLTVREAIRRRLILAVLILTLLIISLTTWGFSRLSTVTQGGEPIPHVEVLATAATLVLLLAFMFSFVLAVGASFLAAPAIAAEIESGLMLAILPRPIHRYEVVCGKWLGLAVLLSCYAALAGGLELWLVNLTTGYVPPHPFLALLCLVTETLVLLSLALYASTRLSPMTGGIIALVLFGVTWIMGIVGSVGAQLGNTTLANMSTVISLIMPTDGMWRGVAFNLEPSVLVAASAGPFAVNGPPTLPYIIWVLVWLSVAVMAATRSFAQRDL